MGEWGGLGFGMVYKYMLRGVERRFFFQGGRSYQVLVEASSLRQVDDEVTQRDCQSGQHERRP